MIKLTTKPRLAYSPVGMSLDNYVGWGTLLFTSSGACNQRCSDCWTKTRREKIREQLSLGANWLYDNSYGVNVLETILDEFKKEGGKLVACMSDGEPLLPSNYDYVSELAKNCGKKDLPLLLFTNGTLLTKEKLSELEKATKGKISYCISMQTGIRNRYHVFAWDEPDIEAGIRLYDMVSKNLSAIQEYDTRIIEQTGKHGVAIHTFIKKETTKDDMETVNNIVKKLGNVPWVVSSMGLNVSESLSGRELEIANGTNKLIEKYSTGPTATLTMGKNQNICSYITHGFYPLEKPQGVFGITFNPYYGAVQTCPYHSELGTTKWLNLRDYLDSIKHAGLTVADRGIREWIKHSIKIEKIITKAVFDFVGYEHCLMRHSKKPEIDLFIARLNIEMIKRKQRDKLHVTDPQYFDKVIAGLEETIGSIVS